MTETRLAAELRNFQEIAAVIQPSPGGIPRLEGIDACALSKPLAGSVGGDHLVFIDFNQRYDLERRIRIAETEGRPRVAAMLRECRERAGFLIADVSGHRETDGLIAAMLHQAFLLGADYELDIFGEITTKLFEHLNQRFYQTTRVNRYLTMLYGEISRQGRFRFISAAHPPPKVFSRETGHFVELGPELLTAAPPVGMFTLRGALDERPEASSVAYKDPYTVNQIDLLAAGDLLLLYTDGLSEHVDGAYFPGRVEQLLAASSHLRASQICQRLWEDLVAAGEPKDDTSFVVIKWTGASRGS